MNTFKELLSMNIIGVITMLMVLILASIEAYNALTKFATTFGIETKWSRAAKKETEMLETHDLQLNSISTDIKATKEKINVLSRMIVEMQAKTDASERAKLKDRISQSYRYYHERGEWNEMEKEAFEDLIRDYEAHGGTNSFVHDICEPESFTWKIIK